MNIPIAFPEILLLVMVCVVLLAGVCIKRAQGATAYVLTQLALVAAFIMVLFQFGHDSQAVYAFSQHYVMDRVSTLSKLVLYFFSFFAFAYARDYLKSHQIVQQDYYLLGLLAVLGMSVMVSANSLLTMYLGLELMSLALYAMVAMYKASVFAAEAAMKYIVLGSLASGFLLYGMSLLYGLTGHLDLQGVAAALSNSPHLVVMVALVFVLAGLIFKFGAVPFHMWVPDVYQGAAAPTTLFIASAPKIAAFVITLRILVESLPTATIDWVHILIAIAILSMFFGNVLAIAQTNIKRMFAYSSIAHIGYVLLGILAGPNSAQGYSAALFYMATYVLVVAGAFAIVSIMSREGISFDNLTDYRGLNARHPWLAFMMLLLLFSMAGVPPTVGFFAKLGLLEALVQAKLVWLAVLALVFAIIGAYYYLRLVMLMYFEEPDLDVATTPIRVSYGVRFLVSINGVAALVLGILPSYFIDLCRVTVG